ncbi:MAG: hypothetical protein K8R86_13410 [Bacteroidales bacterium]|nr:hypothetical protein [Bacteroidales bacterium]
MRNEIFNHIKQNRSRYYSELKKTDEKTSSKEIIIKDQLMEEDPAAHNKKQINPNKPLLNRTEFHFITNSLNKSFGFVSSHSVSLFRRGIAEFNKLNFMLIERTDRITQRFYDVSSRFFEDSSEYSHDREEFNFTSTTRNFQKKSGTLNIAGLNNSALLTLDESYLTSQDRFILWMNKIYYKFILFLESDDWVVENDKRTITNEIKEIKLDQNESNRKTSISGIFDLFKNTNVRKDVLKTIKAGVPFILKNPFVASFNLMCNIELLLLVCKKSLTALFPIINRFIQ